MDGVNALQGYDEYNSISQNRLVSDDVAGLSCFQLIKAHGPCISKWSQDQQGILVGRSEIVRDCQQCDLTVGKGSSSLPPNLTPVVLLQSLELLAYFFSVFLDHFALLMLKFIVRGMCWFILFLYSSFGAQKWCDWRQASGTHDPQLLWGMFLPIWPDKSRETGLNSGVLY